MTAASSRLFSGLSLVLGLIALALCLVFFTTSATGPWLLLTASGAGFIGIILGIIGVVREQAKGMSVTGIVLGSLAVLLGLSLILFAHIFVGAIG